LSIHDRSLYIYAMQRRGNIGEMLKNWILYLLFVFEIILVLRFFLRLVGANPDNTITNAIYSVTKPAITPLIGIFPTDFQARDPTFELFTLFAILIYPFIGFALIQLVQLLFPKPSARY